MSALTSTVEISAILALGLTAAALLRRRSADVRHWVLVTPVVGAWLTLGVGAMAPAWQVGPGMPAWALPRWAEPGVTPINLTTVTDTRTSALDAERGVTVAPTPSVELTSGFGGFAPYLGQIVFWVWATGAGAHILLLLVGLVRLRVVTAGAERVSSGPWRASVDEVSQAVGCRRRVVVLQSEHPAFLMTWGWLRPRILLPAGARNWSQARMRVVVGHEIAHIARGDWALQLLAECLRSVCWFNPLTWVVCARLTRESEQAYDDVVLSLGADGTTYASHLVALARAARPHVGLPAVAMAQPSNLERRVTAMLNPDCERNTVSRLNRTGTALAFVVVAVLVAGLTGVAQSARLAGVVLDQTERPVPAASVSLIDRETQGEFNWSSQHLDDEVLRCRNGNGEGQTGRVGLRCVRLVGRR